MYFNRSHKAEESSSNSKSNKRDCDIAITSFPQQKIDKMRELKQIVVQHSL